MAGTPRTVQAVTTRPTDALPVPQARFLAALIRVYARDGRATIRSVMEEADYRSVGRLHDAARALRDRGLIAFEDDQAGTLRPLVWPIALAPRD